MAAPADFPLPPSVLRNLADRGFDKRRQGAVETEKIVRGLKAAGNQDAIRRVVQLLAQDFAGGLNSNNRKGGLIGLASCAIALGTGMNEYLDSVVPAVLKGFVDAESRVRYYACESLFNIAKICRGAMVSYFNDIFSGLCKLVADVDQECRNGAGLLDRLLKEIVLESPPAELTVHVATFVPLLKAHMAGSVNPYVRQTLIGWVVALDSVPGVDLLPHSHELLGGLFSMLSDGNREVRSAAYTALGGLLDQLDKASLEEHKWAAATRFLTLVDILMSFSGRERDTFARLTALEWLSHILAKPGMRGELCPVFDKLAATLLRCMADAHAGAGGTGGSSSASSAPAGGSDSELVELCVRANGDLQELVRVTATGAFNAPALVRTVAAEAFLCHPDRLARSCALRWTAQLLSQCPAAVLSCVDSIPSLSSGGATGSGGEKEKDGGEVGTEAGASGVMVGADAGSGLLDSLLHNLLDGIDGPAPSGHGAGAGPGGRGGVGGGAGPGQAGGITDSDVLKLTLEVLARLAITDPALLRSRVLSELVRLFASHRALLEGRAAFILRRLCLLLEPRVVYLSLAAILASEPNREFASLLVELLNLLLLTAVELSDFRDSLRGCCAPGAALPSTATPSGGANAGAVVSAKKGAAASAAPPAVPSAASSTVLTDASSATPTSVFLSLYGTWVTNPVAALSLCLLTQAYELGDRIVLALGEASVTLGLLMQVDKLVQLLESPVFLHTRMHLLQPSMGGGRAQAYLLRSLYGLLMLLPQGTAYATLKDRLQAVTNLHIATGGALNGASPAFPSSSSSSASGAGAGAGAGAESAIDTEALFAVFARSQAAARAALSADLRARSLLLSASHGAGGVSDDGSGRGGLVGVGGGASGGAGTTGAGAVAAGQ